MSSVDVSKVDPDYDKRYDGSSVPQIVQIPMYVYLCTILVHNMYAYLLLYNIAQILYVHTHIWGCQVMADL